MNLFKLLPENFFNILTCQNQKQFADCIFLLFNFLGKGSSFGANKEEIVDMLTQYYEESQCTSFLDDFNETLSSSREKAFYTLRKLKQSGWTFEEDDINYQVLVNFHHYTIPLIKSLEELCTNQELEYQGYIYLIYSAVKNLDQNNFMDLIQQIHHNTTIFMNRLKTLNANIKIYIDDLLNKKDINDLKSIVENLFIDYKQNIIDDAYLRLKTSDNVSKYRPFIISKLNEFNLQDKLLSEVCTSLVDAKRFNSIEVAKDFIINMIDYIITSFENLDTIIYEIDKKNAKYIQTSISKILFLVNNTLDLQGKINEILGAIGRDKLDVDKLFHINHQKYLDEASLYTMPTKYEAINQVVTTSKVLTEEEKNQRLDKFLNSNQLSKQNIMNVVKEILKNKQAIKASEVPLVTLSDYIRIILIYLYSNSADTYLINKLDYQYQNNLFSFVDFEIAKK